MRSLGQWDDHRVMMWPARRPLGQHGDYWVGELTIRSASWSAGQQGDQWVSELTIGSVSVDQWVSKLTMGHDVSSKVTTGPWCDQRGDVTSEATTGSARWLVGRRVDHRVSKLTIDSAMWSVGQQVDHWVSVTRQVDHRVSKLTIGSASLGKLIDVSASWPLGHDVPSKVTTGSVRSPLGRQVDQRVSQVTIRSVRWPLGQWCNQRVNKVTTKAPMWPMDQQVDQWVTDLEPVVVPVPSSAASEFQHRC